MRITAKVKTNSRIDDVQVVDESTFIVRVKAKPTGGEANAAVLEVLSEFFDKPKTDIRIIRGQTSSTKIIDII